MDLVPSGIDETGNNHSVTLPGDGDDNTFANVNTLALVSMFELARHIVFARLRTSVWMQVAWIPRRPLSCV